MKTLTKHSDLSPLETIKRDMDLIFDEISPLSGIRRGNGGFGMQLWAPDTDLSETEEAYTLTVDLPGLNKKDIEVSYKDNRLTISGERKEEKKEEGKDFLRKERYLGTFSRSFSMPSDVKEEMIRASFKEGVLTVNIPKAEVKKPKQVSIE